MLKSFKQFMINVKSEYNSLSFDVKSYFVAFVVCVLIFISYIANIVKVATGFTGFDELSGLMMIRIIGIVVAPIGVVMGCVPS